MMVCSLSLLYIVTLQKQLCKEKPGVKATRNTGISWLKIKNTGKQLKKWREINLIASEFNHQVSGSQTFGMNFHVKTDQSLKRGSEHTETEPQWAS